MLFDAIFIFEWVSEFFFLSSVMDQRSLLIGSSSTGRTTEVGVSMNQSSLPFVAGSSEQKRLSAG
jgi:hypothetical protein